MPSLFRFFELLEEGNGDHVAVSSSQRRTSSPNSSDSAEPIVFSVRSMHSRPSASKSDKSTLKFGDWYRLDAALDGEELNLARDALEAPIVVRPCCALGCLPHAPASWRDLSCPSFVAAGVRGCCPR